MPRPDARGLVALSTFATVAFVAPPAAPTPNAMPQVDTGSAILGLAEADAKRECAHAQVRDLVWAGALAFLAHLRHGSPTPSDGNAQAASRSLVIRGDGFVWRNCLANRFRG